MIYLKWETKELAGIKYEEAILGDFDGEDGVRFSLVYQPTCNRRGQQRLLIEVSEGKADWGCFDEADQPMRYYHNRICAFVEAEAIAHVLWQWRYGPDKKAPRSEGPQ